ncbi:Ig-like domain-containing protein, partial [Candidatus Dojkabacteria bacterium]|nr:Ig-like domain-containing protein [Candidatus Dojkabacteria bacterium]
MTLLSKLNNFLADRFNYYLTLTVSGLVLALLVLAILNLGSRPHVKSIYFEGGATQLTTVLAPKLLIDFAQPMDRQSVEDALLLSPAVEFDTSWSLNKLQIKFKYNLDSGTNYHLQIGDQAKDIFGTQIAPVVDFSFTTPELSFVYLERNSREYQPDRIIRYFIGANTEKVLYSADNIIGFTENDNYLVVAVRTDSGSALRIVDFKQDSFVTLDWGGDNLLVGKVHMSPVADQIAFTAQVVEMVNGIAVPKTA